MSMSPQAEICPRFLEMPGKDEDARPGRNETSGGAGNWGGWGREFLCLNETKMLDGNVAVEL
jgi:hypothetical protein